MFFMNIQSPSTLPEIISYDLQIEVWADKVSIQVDGKLEVRNPDSYPLQGLTLYLHPELSVTSVTDQDDRPSDYETKAIAHDWSYTKSLASHSLILTDPINPGDTQTVKLSYEGSFSPSSLRSPSDFMRIDKQGAYLRGLGYSLWFPVTVPDGIGAASRFHIQLAVPPEWTGVAFGDLERSEDSGHRSLSWWRTRSPFKLLQTQLIAAPLEVFEGKHLSVFATPGSSRSARKLIEFGDRLLEFFADNYGLADGISRNYVVETCQYGCIASGNVIGLSPDVFQRVGTSDIDFETYDLIAHEFVHLFVTPLINQDSPGAALLLEGFPSYFHFPALTSILGNDYHKWFMQRAWLTYREELNRQTDKSNDPSIPIEKPLVEIGIEEIPYYKDKYLLSDKFPILLDRLQEQIGADVFFGACKDFFAHAATHSVTIDDFFRTLAVHSKQDWSEFVSRWLASTEPLPESWAESLLED